MVDATPPRKRIILCLDGTFDDISDTPERLNPGSAVSRFLRWVLPPAIWMTIWGVGLFAVWKRIERCMFGKAPHKASFHTNVSLLASAIKSDHDTPQLVMYIGGIGAIGNPQSRIEEAATGNTMTYKLRQAYRLIVDNYCPGDEIFLFGFSRGAFAARALAGFIDWAGLLRKSNVTEYFDLVWEKYENRGVVGLGSDYQEEHEKRDVESDFEHTEKLKLVGEITIGSIRHPSSNRIRCVGVWDTVASLGAPPLCVPHSSQDVALAREARKRRKFFDPELKNSVEYAFQALALDEQRFDFYPLVWRRPDPRADRNFAQVWFPGVHTDVGGGNGGSVSRYAFVWMISQIQAGDLLKLDDKFLGSILEELEKPTNSKGDAKAPWNLPIGSTHPVYSWVGRRAYRNPNLPTLAVPADVETTPSGYATAEWLDILGREQQFHWTVIERIKHVGSSYWGTCSALRRRYPPSRSIGDIRESIMERKAQPLGLDKRLRDTWIDEAEASSETSADE